MRLRDEMKHRILFCDGGTGSLLQAQGLEAGELPETWNIKRPEVLREVHRSYLRAGCDIINTNTFGANRLKFNSRTEYSLEEIVVPAVRNARAAVEAEGHGYVALDLGPTGKLLQPLGDLSFEDAVDIYREVIEIGVREGVDLILIETMSDSLELKAAVLAAKENSELPVFATVIFDEKGRLLTGGDAASVVALLEGLKVDALGINCGLGPVQMKPILKDILAVSSTPVIVNPNAGLPRSENGKTVYDIGVDEFAAEMADIVDMGACIVGGCCGTTPEHLETMIGLCREKPLKLPEKKERTVVSSYSQTVVIGDDPVIIGERINPTGKSKFKQALRDHDLEYILKEAVTQQDNGAHILDVNVGLPEIDEPSMMEEVVRELQAVTDLPLQIDTSDTCAMERALRAYNGKPMINSVNGKSEVMEAVFPLAAKYGGVLVALTLDEGGIPDTADARIAIAERIIRRAAEYGIDKRDIVIDALCMTISSDPKGALTTLEAVRGIRERLGVRTILGVSNISFGLPQREIVNATFFALALQNGLSAAIINPNSEAMMRSYMSYRALAGLDEHCKEYIDTYSGRGAGLGQTIRGGKAAETSVGAALSLEESIEKGLKERAGEAALELLKEEDPLAVINGRMVPALDRVGKGFEKGTIFLPQLLMSAEAAREAFAVIKEHLSKAGLDREKKGKVILATVKGDIHDIGKNIVRVLLENYSFDVIDLGKDVPPETVVETAIREQVPLVGLSALMTTTVPSMEETIRQLHERAPGVKIMVGGAVLTEEYARTIHADAYCRDAMASVNYAERVFAGMKGEI